MKRFDRPTRFTKAWISLQRARDDINKAADALDKSLSGRRTESELKVLMTVRHDCSEILKQLNQSLLKLCNTVIR